MTLMTLKEILAYLHISKATFYNYKKKGFPVRYANGKNGKVFAYKEEIDEWLKEGR